MNRHTHAKRRIEQNIKVQRAILRGNTGAQRRSVIERLKNRQRYRKRERHSKRETYKHADKQRDTGTHAEE